MIMMPTQDNQPIFLQHHIRLNLTRNLGPLGPNQTLSAQLKLATGFQVEHIFDDGQKLNVPINHYQPIICQWIYHDLSRLYTASLSLVNGLHRHFTGDHCW